MSSIRLAVLLALGLSAAALATVAPAQDATPPSAGPDAVTVAALAEALLVPRIVEVMAREGQAYSEELAQSLFGDRTLPASWVSSVAAVYDPVRMEARVAEGLELALEGTDIAAMTAFYATEPGRTFSRLEVMAREAMLEKDVEQAAKEAAAVAMAGEDPRLDLIGRYVEAIDLVDSNVAGALNASYAYYMGLMDGGATSDGVSADDILLDVMAAEPQVRADTTEWIYAFLLMAYAPASDADLEALVAFAGTEAGQDLNAALFGTFDALFQDVSRELGRAAARVLTTQDI